MAKTPAPSKKTTAKTAAAPTIKPIKETLSKSGLVAHIAEASGVAAKDVRAVMAALEGAVAGSVHKKGAGTFMLPGDEVMKFGITKELGTNDPFRIWAFEFKYLLRDLWFAPGIKAKILVLFGKPGETYEYSRTRQIEEADPVMIAAE